MKKSLSIRAYLGLSHVLLLATSLGIIGLVWSASEYRLITRQLEGILQQRVSLLADFVSHEIQEHDRLTLDETEFRVVDQQDNMLAVFFDNSEVMHELMPGTVSPLQADIFRELQSDYQVGEPGYTTLIHTAPSAC